MTRIISALLLALVASFATAQEAAPIQLADNAPERHIVVPGDTLWGISSKFLKEPWRWPEVWRMNKDQIKNPHRIYPGDVIVLDRDANGNPMLRVAKDGKLLPKVYGQQIDKEIPSIPANIIEPYLTEPLILDSADALSSSPRIIATQEDRVHIGTGDTFFVTGAAGSPTQETWQIYRSGKPVIDPENGESILGHEAFFLGTAVQVQSGDPAIFRVRSFKQEIGRGDRLIPAPRPPLINYAPHRPPEGIEGRIISVYGGVGTGGKSSIIAINRGQRSNLELGHVLAIWRNRSDTFFNSEFSKTESYALPQERYGLAFVFRVFDSVAYALVLTAAGAVEQNDIIRTP